MDAWDLVRWVNLPLSVWLLAVCTMRLMRDWNQWTHREKVVRVHLTAYLFAITYGTTEALKLDVPPGPRVLLILVVHISFALALWRTRNDPVR